MIESTKATHENCPALLEKKKKEKRKKS